MLLATEPDRGKQIDGICEMIRNASRAGIPSVKYNLTFIGVPRTAPTPGRGGARYSTFVYEGAKPEPALTIAGPIDADTYWERITYFLERVVPVAAEHKVRLACHPQDPGMPRGKGWRGVETVLGSVDGLKRFVSIAESPYHGLNFCQGTVSEMLEKPGEQIFDVCEADRGTVDAAVGAVVNEPAGSAKNEILNGGTSAFFALSSSFLTVGDICAPRSTQYWARAASMLTCAGFFVTS